MPAVSMRRRDWLVGVALAGLTGLGTAQPAYTTVTVWKDPGCGCCKDWVAHLQKNGFHAVLHDSGNTEARARLGMPQRLGSCHTALVDGYAIEGHVPAADIHRLLKEKPVAVGLAVPGMPIGSPGMDGQAYGGQRQRFDVLLVLKDRSSKIFNTYS